MKVLLTLNPEHVTASESRTYSNREACRAVVMDRDGAIALLFVAKNTYYKLPGGGIEAGEDRMNALRRECKEEAGVDIKVLQEVGSIVEFRKYGRLRQTSFCYLVQAVGTKQEPTFTDSEQAHHFRLSWHELIEAKQLLHTTQANSIEGRDYIVPRDQTFLKEAEKYFQK